MTPKAKAIQLTAAGLLLLTLIFLAQPASSQTARYVSARRTPTAVSPAAASTVDQVRGDAAKIDQFIETGYREHNVSTNPVASDDVFVRRIYLDIIGRIPTYDEATSFLDSRNPNKRAELIDKLLDSPGYVQNYFNYWADLLRIQSRQRRVPAQPYIDWVKQSLTENKPYDQMVWELLTAEGYTWEDGAAGYYQRDMGMPLDNMSNTVQAFLGTRIVCAQCHDHPFDVWTQHEYYEMAAFSFGVQTRARNPQLRELQSMVRKDRDKFEGREAQAFQAANQRIVQPLAFKVQEVNNKLHLPKDYKYDDAKPNDVVSPATIFGDVVDVKAGHSKVEAFADWVVSPNNPRFSRVIANRLWKKAMGVGLIEPVDDIKGNTVASNEPLMTYLTERMAELKYDVKQYLRMVFNSKTYQRSVNQNEVEPGEPYYFPGPILRRMTAEQLWDSYLTLAVPDIDERQGINRQPYDIEKLREAQNMSAEELYALVQQEYDTIVKTGGNRRKFQQMREQMQAAEHAGDLDKVKAIRQEMRGQGRDMMRMGGDTGRRIRDAVGDDVRWRGYPREAVRAAEVDSPAPPGHFLRQFGQSDREVIENANDDASVPQVLTLLNGTMLRELMNDRSVLARSFASAKSSREKLEILYVGILTRKPTPVEADYLLRQVRADNDTGFGDIVWALLNTRQFMFIQ